MNDKPMDLARYRERLEDLGHQMQSEYDKAIMALSGGGLGITLTFLKDIVLQEGLRGRRFLVAGWFFWGFSLACVLLSYAVSARAMRRAVDQTDRKTIHEEQPGGIWEHLTGCLNLAAGLLFFGGLFSTILFTCSNL
jgi:hypothetical protein